MVKVLYLYDKTGSAAERSYVMKQVVAEINRRYRYMDEPDTFLEITGDEKEDLHYLKCAQKKGYRVFVSALGSTLCKYLGDLFFNHVEGILHVNSFSTAVSLEGYRGLLRIFPPDSLNLPIFANLIGDNKAYLIYGEDSVWGSGLANGIASNLKEGQSVMISYVEGYGGLVDKANSLIQPSDQDTKVVIISDHALELSKMLRQTLESRLSSFQFLYGDATGDSVFEDTETFLFVQKHKGTILQPHIDNNGLELAKQLNDIIDNKEHPVSSQVSLFLEAMDVGYLALSTLEPHKRKFYGGLTLNNLLDNTTSLYSLNRFKDLTTYDITGFAYIAAGQVFITKEPE